MNQIVEKPKTGARIEEERNRRRRRDELGDGRMRNLAVNGKLDPNYTYRWVNDDPGRMYNLTQADDWDVVQVGDLGEAHPKDKGVGTGIERVVDKVTGKRAVLLRKPKDYYLADKAKEQARIDVEEAAMRKGQTKGADSLTSGREAAQAYVPAGGIAIANGARG
jgi:hypothetical protein